MKTTNMKCFTDTVRIYSNNCTGAEISGAIPSSVSVGNTALRHFYVLFYDVKHVSKQPLMFPVFMVAHKWLNKTRKEVLGDVKQHDLL